MMSQIKIASNSNTDAQNLLMAIFRSIPAARRVAEANGLGGRPEGMHRKAS
jgi:hypothetical protein